MLTIWLDLSIYKFVVFINNGTALYMICKILSSYRTKTAFRRSFWAAVMTRKIVLLKSHSTLCADPNSFLDQYIFLVPCLLEWLKNLQWIFCSMTSLFLDTLLSPLPRFATNFNYPTLSPLLGEVIFEWHQDEIYLLENICK